MLAQSNNSSGGQTAVTEYEAALELATCQGTPTVARPTCDVGHQN